jgi:predicted nucleotidyltransferase
MNAIVQAKLPELVDICYKHGVYWLALFGSAVNERPVPALSDLDFLVKFKPMPPAKHADNYFGLLESLEQLFGLPVDLIELEPIRNPYFREAVEETQVVLYEAA